MQYFKNVVLIALSIAGVSVASVPAGVTSVASLPFPSAAAVWTGPSNGVNITLTGMNADQIKTHLKSLDPDWEPVNKTAVQTRTVETLTSTLCCPVANWNWPYSNPLNLQTAASQVSAVGGDFFVGSNTCIQTACFDGAGIWLCDAVGNGWNVPGDTIGSYADNINVACGFTTGCGQVFDNGGWNVIGHGGC